MKYGLSETTVENICAVFARFPEIEKAILYGSRAKGNFKTGSDIDLTLCGEALTSDLRSTIASELDDLLLPYVIDLSIFDELNHTKLREHIKRVGVVFYERANQCAAVKKGWDIKTLGTVSKIVNGGTPKTGVSEYWNGTHLWITPAEMGKRQSPYVENTERKLSNAGLDNSSAQLLPPYSVILSSRAPIGHLVVNTKPMATNQGCKGLIPNSILYYKFLYYYLYHNVDLLNSLGTGATFKELSGGKLKEIPFPFPPLPEQKRIVGILDEAFAAISTAKENAEKNLQNARELFESYLQSIFANPGDGWEICNIEDYIKFIDYRGRTPKKTEKGLRLITAKNVKIGYLQLEPQEFINPDAYDTWMTRGIPKLGDVIFTTEAPLANVTQLDTKDKVAFAQRIIVMQPQENKINQTFLKYILLSNPIRQKILAKGTGATVQGIKARLLKKIEIYFPATIKEQKRIIAKLDTLSAETKKLESLYKQKLADLDELKKSILHKAFNGEL